MGRHGKTRLGMEGVWEGKAPAELRLLSCRCVRGSAGASPSPRSDATSITESLIRTYTTHRKCLNSSESSEKSEESWANASANVGRSGIAEWAWGKFSGDRARLWETRGPDRIVAFARVEHVGL
jgi:hypothetical protein